MNIFKKNRDFRELLREWFEANEKCVKNKPQEEIDMLEKWFIKNKEMVITMNLTGKNITTQFHLFDKPIKRYFKKPLKFKLDGEKDDV